MPPIFIQSADVAQRLGLTSANAFLRKRVELEDDHGFPPPMPQSRRPLMWRAELVDNWLQRIGTETDHQTPQHQHAPQQAPRPHARADMMQRAREA